GVRVRRRQAGAGGDGAAAQRERGGLRGDGDGEDAAGAGDVDDAEGRLEGGAVAGGDERPCGERTASADAHLAPCLRDRRVGGEDEVAAVADDAVDRELGRVDGVRGEDARAGHRGGGRRGGGGGEQARRAV